MFLVRLLARLLNAAAPPRPSTESHVDPPTIDPPFPRDASVSERARVKGVSYAQRELYRRGIRLLEQGAYGPASETFVAFAAACPAMAADGWVGAARAARGLHGYAESVPAEPIRHPLSEEQRRQAVECYRTALAADPEHPRALIGLAQLIDIDSAERIDLLERAHSVYKKYPRPTVPYAALVALGDSYKLAHRFADAERIYREAAESAPHHANAHRRLVALFADTDRPAEAKQWQRALSKRKGRPERATPAAPRDNTAPDPLPASVWCVVANVVTERPFGPGGEIRTVGTRHFSPKTKVYLIEARPWEDKAIVLGRHRGSHRWTRMWIAASALSNFRAKLIYEPAVIRRLNAYWDGSPASHKRAEAIVAGMTA